MDYLAPGVYVQEVPENRSIQPVTRPGAAFMGPALNGPVEEPVGPLRSLEEYAEVFAGESRLEEGGVPDILSDSVRAFFLNGGRALHVVRLSADQVGQVTSYERALRTLEFRVDVGVVATPVAHRTTHLLGESLQSDHAIAWVCSSSSSVLTSRIVIGLFMPRDSWC